MAYQVGAFRHRAVPTKMSELIQPFKLGISGISTDPMRDVHTEFGRNRATSVFGRTLTSVFSLVQVSTLRTPLPVDALAWLLACNRD